LTALLFRIREVQGSYSLPISVILNKAFVVLPIPIRKISTYVNIQEFRIMMPCPLAILTDVSGKIPASSWVYAVQDKTLNMEVA